MSSKPNNVPESSGGGIGKDVTYSDSGFSRMVIWNLLRNQLLSSNKDVGCTFLQNFGRSFKKNLTDEEIRDLGRIIKKDLTKFDQKWIGSSRILARFKRKHGEWAGSQFRVPANYKQVETQPKKCSSSAAESVVLDNDEQNSDSSQQLLRASTSTPKVIKRQQRWDEMAPRSKRRHVQTLRNSLVDEPIQKIMAAAAGVAKSGGT